MLVDLTEVTGQAQSFVEKHEKTIVRVAAAILILGLGFILWKYFYKMPREKEAKEQMYMAQQQFAKDSFALALQNPGGGFKGFIDISKQYSGTKAANLANYYAGTSYMYLGEYDAAISYLEDFCPCDSEVMPAMKDGLLGDAYAEKGDFAKSLKYYEKAARASDNGLSAPYYLFKLGLLSEKQGDSGKALASFKQIKEKFPTSVQGADIDKYIARVSKK